VYGGNPGKKVNISLKRIFGKAKLAAEREYTQLEDFAKNLDSIDQLEKWDGAYYF